MENLPLLGRHQRWITLAGVALVYFAICTDGTGNPWPKQDFGDIYDHQAVSLVAGRLDLPPAVIGGEAFVVDGKYYGYWPPFPALLRVPLALTGSSFWIGHTSRLLCWLAALLSVYAVNGIMAGLQRLCGWEPGAAGFMTCFVAALALGSHLPYLLAGTSIYHEAVLWGTALALVALQLGLGFLHEGRFALLLGAVLAAGASALSRATPGYGALISTAGLVGLYGWRQWCPTATAKGTPGRIALLVVLTGVMFMLPLLYNYVRFGSFVRLPYDKHPNVAPWRQEITRHGNFQLVNLGPNAAAYFDPGHVDVRPGFPYFHLAAYQPNPAAKIEHAEAYAAIPAFMTGLCLLAGLGVVGLRRDWRIGILLAGGGATLAALLAFTAVAHRYEHDIFPLMVLLSGTGALWLASRRGVVGGMARTLLVVLLVFGIWQSLSFAHFELEWARGWAVGGK